VNITAAEVFPGLGDLIPAHRYRRVEEALQSLFTKTLCYMDDGLPFIITGDIPAMWLRDSTWQVKPLLHSADPRVVDLLINLSKTQVKLFLIDPYANAFNPKPNGNCWRRDFPDQSPWVFERKYELDSWASILYLARKIREVFNRSDHLDQNFELALEMILKLARIEQSHDRQSYIFKRTDAPIYDSLSHDGLGAPVAHTGMIYSAFRPSDDACTYGYLIPSNLFFKNELTKLGRPDASLLAAEIEAGVEKYALADGVLAYEVDGLGNQLFMDDANVPSLLSLPYLEALPSSDPRYEKTRAFVLSSANPYFYEGSISSGVGSQHTPARHVWPIALAIQALTSNDQPFALEMLELLEINDAKTGRMHESFHVDDDSIFTRDWFSWSDMTYVDLVLQSVGYSHD